MEEDRREFLKKFALLSSTSLMIVGCPNAVYGPPPTNEQKNIIIYYKDSNGNLVSLHQKENIPLNLTIVVKFPNKMSSETKNNIHLLDKKEELISCNKKWKTEYILELQPIKNSIEYNSDYKLTINTAIQDKSGNLLTQNEYAFVAEFKTTKDR